MARPLPENIPALGRLQGQPDLCFHDLRHAKASLLVELNTHSKVVQVLLGQSPRSLTLDAYSYVIPTLQQEAVKTMALLMEPG